MTLEEVLKGELQELPQLTLRVLHELTKTIVLDWTTAGTSVQPAILKANKVVAVTDGACMTAITLYESRAQQMKMGLTYIIGDYILIGPFGSKKLSLGPESFIMETVDMEVTEAQLEQGRELLEPPSTPVALGQNIVGHHLALKRVVDEIFITRLVTVKGKGTPIKLIRLAWDQTSSLVSLWREATLSVFNIGQMLTATHVKGETSLYGLRYGTTNYTTIMVEAPSEAKTLITVKGSTRRGANMLVSDGKGLFVSPAESWREGDRKVPFTIEAVLAGTKILSYVVKEEEDKEKED
ncbi:uncharacterized protein [Eucyclogobius newberryi]